jgi:hypothetical protein
MAEDDKMGVGCSVLELRELVIAVVSEVVVGTAAVVDFAEFVLTFARDALRFGAGPDEHEGPEMDPGDCDCWFSNMAASVDSVDADAGDDELVSLALPESDVFKMYISSEIFMRVRDPAFGRMGRPFHMIESEFMDDDD